MSIREFSNLTHNILNRSVCTHVTGVVVYLTSFLIRKSYETRPDTRLPKLRVGGQGLYLRPLHHLGRSSEAKDRKNPKIKV